MGGQWVLIQLTETETLKCISCGTYIYIQKVHLYLNVNGEIEEVMCSTCWKRNQKEGVDNGRTIP